MSRFADLQKLCLIALAFLCSFAQPASANNFEGRTCALFSDEKLTLDEVLVRDGWICGEDREDFSSKHTWLRIPLEALGAGELALKGDAMATSGILIAELSDRGVRFDRYWPEDQIAKEWTAGTSYILPLNNRADALDTVLLRFDRPFDPLAVRSVELVDVAKERQYERDSLIVMAAISGMLLLVAVISLVMAWAVRSAYALWHFVNMSLLFVFTISSTSIIFLIFPDLGLWQRSAISYVSLALAVAAVPPILLTVVGREVVSRTNRRLLLAAGLITASAATYLPIAWITGLETRPFYYLAFAPTAVAISVQSIILWRQGSREAKGFLLAWMVPLLFGSERILRGVGLSPFSNGIDHAAYFGIAAEAIGMTFLIAWTVARLRSERDSALVNSAKMAREARHDALTGLKNRRDFDHSTWRKTDILALIDLDRFKSINDTYGHDVGDDTLRAVGRSLRSASARSQVRSVWRLGGEEFAIAIEGQTLEQATETVETIRQDIGQAIRAEVSILDRKVTASAGVCHVSEGIMDAYRKADDALYAAKNIGRDRLYYVDPEDKLVSYRIASAAA